MAKRINVILPEATNRSSDRAVRHYVAPASPEALQERLKHAALRDHDLDLGISRDWFAVDREHWRRLETQGGLNVAAVRKEAKSASRRSTRR